MPIAATALLVVNDHVLKGSGLLPGWLTGKLSDFAGLFVFPIFLFVVADVLTRGRSTQARGRTAIGAALVTAAGFSAVKLVPGVNALVHTLLDPSDLIALPACALAALWLVREPLGAPSSALRALACAAVALACVATSAPRLVRNYPMWKVESLGKRRIGCGEVDVWVSKSGKQGIGVTVRIAPASSGPCQARITRARFSAGPTAVDAESAVSLEKNGKSHLYLPFVFDNETLWNDEHHTAQLELVIQVGDREERLVLNLRHVWSGAHHVVERDRSEPPDAQAPLQFAEPPR